MEGIRRIDWVFARMGGSGWFAFVRWMWFIMVMEYILASVVCVRNRERLERALQ